MVEPAPTDLSLPGCARTATLDDTTPATSLPQVLPPGMVELWFTSLDVPPAELDEQRRVLSETELARARRFHFDRDRNRFIAGRGWLRGVLSGYLGMPAEKLQLAIAARGKPVLDGPTRTRGLEFNLAHTEGVAVLGVACGAPVGIDVERVRHLEDASELVARFFSKSEAARFRTLAPELRDAAFFNLWTRKEAWLKATGEGIAHLLDQVEVSFEPGEEAQLLGIPPGFGNATEWSLASLAPVPGFVAAVAAPVKAARIVWRARDHAWPGGAR